MVGMDDGLHYRHPWVVGVQEEIEILSKRVEEAEQVIKGVWNLNKRIETLEEQVRNFSGQVDYLTVEVADLEKDDGLHYRHPWVVGVQEEIEILSKRVEEAEQVIKGVWNLNKRIETLEEQVRNLCGQVDYLTVEVADLEKVTGMS
ncbi:hypothetical protein F2Q69_00016111 [Brassica cretica]|uniref:Uncharacterized protein n=1 Tax=Brassica cretica TaxID=69181 RepID=A0A8S9R7B0_BRACR|nr:hypothetical protein F2Q69_00016111 [Brassica cretica]